MVTQLNVFMENKRGRLYEIARLLGDAGINVKGFSVADMADFGILRLIVPDPDRAREVLKGAGFAVSESEVVVVAVPDEPGGLAGVLAVLDEGGVSIEYLYIIAETKLAFALDDNEAGARLLRAAGIPVLDAEDVARL